MRISISVAAGLACLSWASPASPAEPAKSTTYYAGDARVTDLARGTTSTQSVLLARTIDPQESLITEVACIAVTGHRAIVSPVYVKVRGSSFDVSDAKGGATGMLIGTGFLRGTPWAWNYLYFSMDYAGQYGAIHIEDDNYLAGGKLIARKSMFATGGAPAQLWEAELAMLDEKSFATKGAELGCPTSPQ